MPGCEGAWESNPPAPLYVTHSSFEDCEAHRDLFTPVIGYRTEHGSVKEGMK